MSNLCIDFSTQSLNKYGELLCGDHVKVVRQNENSIILVLADGLGSGVKASILSTLTSTIISTMMAHAMSIEECVSTIAKTLPVCEKRGIAYSTFTIIRLTDLCEAEIIQYDNPHVIVLRNGTNYEYEKTGMKIGERIIYRSKLKTKESDVFIAVSDGALYAGIGRTLNYDWQREHIIAFMEQLYKSTCTAKTMSALLINECYRLYGERPGDDTTVSVIQVRKKRPVSVLIGPPLNAGDVNKMMSQFFSETGRHVVCGGTTSLLAAGYLNKELNTEIKYLDAEIPPTAEIDGVDLVTEGIITMNKVLKNAQEYLLSESLNNWDYKKDGASLLSSLLFEEATDIHFFVGRAINPAHQNPSLPHLKTKVVEELCECLIKMGKRVTIRFF